VSPQAPAASTAPPKFKRSAKNYLLDKSFQLKYTGYIVGITAAVSLALGAMLFWQSEKTVAIGSEAVQVGQKANQAGKDAVTQSQALNSKLENDALMSYGDNPALLSAIKDANKVESDKINKRAQDLSDYEKNLVAKSEALTKQRTLLLATLTSALLLMIVLLGLAGIVITHKVAGPIFKMKRLLREVGEGKLVVPGRLRKGDELVEFFDVFATMVEKLRVRQEKEIELLDAAIAQAKADNNPVLDKLEGLRKHMQRDLDAK
jgi:nitrogen fixation/metabolism regulation signal transduction histidine kinase